MKKNNILLLFAAALLPLAGCTKGLGPADAGDISVEASIGTLSKVSYEGDASAFASGDKIAVYAWTGSTAEVPASWVVDGVVNTFDGSAWTPASLMRWKSTSDSHHFLGVSPVRDITSFTADALTLNTSAYAASDLLIARKDNVPPSVTPVALGFSHVMARISVNIKLLDEFSAADVTGVTVLAKNGAVVNYLAGTVSSTGTAANQPIPAADTAPDGYQLSYSGIQVPQEGVRSITVTVAGKEFAFWSGTDIPLVSGKHTTLNFNIGKDKIKLESVSLADWQSGGKLMGGEADVVITAKKWLTFTTEGTTTLSLGNTGDNAPTLYYSTDKTNWTAWDYSTLSFSKGKPLYICGDNLSGLSGPETSKFSTFSASGSVFGIEGDVMSLLNKNAELLEIPDANCFKQLFNNCTLLTRAPDLPATTLKENCYSAMFRGCINLQTAPDLPAETLAQSCYEKMFYGCTSLTTTPMLRAKAFVQGCYNYMFSGCSSLSQVRCFATNLDNSSSCLAEWLYDVQSEGSFIQAEDVHWPSGKSGVPTGWVACAAVDLGLPSGRLWASYNLGADAPEAPGDYFAWGETAVKAEYDWSTYKWCNIYQDKLTRYCPMDRTDNWGGSGDPDGKSDFMDYNYADDAARKALGGKWRVPATDDWQELKDNCSKKWQNVNGMGGIRFTATNGNSIFFPAAGCMIALVGLIGRSSNGNNGNGYYWCSSINPENPQGAMAVRFTPLNEALTESAYRDHGHNIRAVTD